ncbi:SCO2524 family protein [Frankia sp. Cr2]|uniref:SCO2524 family protein n=1 Tax=Frankia sp. Cr2 TaxID=3073932 RepID=UPI002AD53B0E|nr:SCO2524 family protein [Frankia sp. Cr2]
MRIQPRQHILDIWRAVLATSYPDGSWVWGGRDESNSISDAEQLLCILYPATTIENLGLDRPDAIADDVRTTLKPLGDSNRIPRVIVEILGEYIDRYSDEKGQPVFTGGRYLRREASGRQPSATVEQLELDVVDAYSMSVTLCLAALGFLNVYKPIVERRPEARRKIDEIHSSTSRRLTAAMLGLLRSFVVKTVEPDEPHGRSMIHMMNAAGVSERTVIQELRNSLARIRARLRDDVRIGLGSDVALDNENLLFECGWAWGIAENAGRIDFVGEEFQQRSGVAEARPYLYFTVVALDGINDLLSPRTRELGLLNEEQRRLAEALQIRWDLTQRYWSTVARFGDQAWPLENIPWQTSDGKESDYYSLLVSSVLVQDLVNRRATDDDLTRAVQVFEELARRGRITSRVTKDDPAVALHVPGVQMTLNGSEDLGPQLYWSAADFAPLLLKRTLQAAKLSANVAARDRLMAVAEATMDHLARRRLRGGPGAGLWDDPVDLLLPAGGPADSRPSWYLTERMIEGFVAAADTYEEMPLRTTRMVENARELLSEADHLLNQEILQADSDDRSELSTGLLEIEATLTRARRILSERPSSASALAMEALRKLDELAVARIDAARII